MRVFCQCALVRCAGHAAAAAATPKVHLSPPLLLLPAAASDFVAQLRRIGKGHGTWHFDHKLYEGEVLGGGRDGA